MSAMTTKFLPRLAGALQAIETTNNTLDHGALSAEQQLSICIRSENDTNEAYKILMGLLHNVHLAQEIRVIKFYYINYFLWAARFYRTDDDFSQTEAHDILNEEEMTMVTNAIKALELDDPKAEESMLRSILWKAWHLAHGTSSISTTSREMMDDDFMFAVVPLILSLATNLESLEIPDQSTTPLKSFYSKANYAILARPALQSLRHLTVHFGADNGNTIGAIKLFHRLPAIESIAVSGICEQGDYVEFFLPPHTSGIKRIEIIDSDLSSEVVATIVRIPRALEEFTLTITPRRSSDGSRPMFYSKGLAKALYTQKKSLTKLDLDIDRSCGHQEEEEDHDTHDRWLEEELLEDDEFWLLDAAISTGPIFLDELPRTQNYGDTMGSFRDFTCLKELAIGVRALLGVDIETPPPFRLVHALPTSLEILRIRGYQGYDEDDGIYTDQIEELMQSKHALLPSLKQVEFLEQEISSDEEDL